MARPSAEARATGLHRHPTLVGGAVIGLVALLLVPAGALLGQAFRPRSGVAREMRPMAERSTVYAADGSVIGELGVENRGAIRSLDEVPPVMIEAVLAAEDRTFWTNGGINVKATLRALRANVGEGGVLQGGSTITQQLVKNRILTPQRSLSRKLEEMVLALELKHELGGRRVLLEYLNTAYFGEGSYGVISAAERIVGKPLGALQLADATLLAGLIESPGPNNPYDHPEQARHRRAQVLAAMVAQGTVAVNAAETAAAAALRPRDLRPPPDLRPRTYFVDEVQRRLLADPRLGDNGRREPMLLRGGLRIETTLDPRLQQLAEQAVADTLPQSVFTAALAAIDPTSGAVRALVGGSGYADAQFDVATQGRRQPGSSFKMITLATALENGYSPEDTVDGRAGCSFRVPGQPTWEPGGNGLGIITLREATVNSINCAYARLIFAVGATKVVSLAHAMGITSPVPAVPSITLGAAEAAPLEMASVAATIAADGIHHPPVFVTKVTGPDGHAVFEDAKTGTRAISAQTARTLTDVLAGVIERGTAVSADIGRPAFGKTGTTDDQADAWFVGGSPQLVTAVWMGAPQSRVPMPDINGRPVFGGTFPAEIWARFMRPALAPAAVVAFPAPDRSLWPASTYVSELGRGVTQVPGTNEKGGGKGGSGKGEGGKKKH